VTERKGGGDEAHGGAGISDKEIGFSCGKGAASTLDHEPLTGLIFLDRYSQVAQGTRHVGGVIAVQGAVERRFTVGECRDQQGPIGDTFRTRDPGHPVDGATNRGHRKDVGQSVRLVRWGGTHNVSSKCDGSGNEKGCESSTLSHRLCTF
jgi:hypothetical protein